MKKFSFTLIEMLVAMVIMVILAGMIMGASRIANRLAKKRSTQAQLRAIEIILEQYKTDWGFYPESNGVLELDSWAAWYFLHLREPKSPPSQEKYEQSIYIDLFAGSFTTLVDDAAKTSPPALNPTVPPAPAYHNYFYSPSGPLYVVDAFSQGFFYQNPGVMNTEKFDLWSMGPDGAHGVAGVDDNGDITTDNPSDAQCLNALESDDISNWGNKK